MDNEIHNNTCHQCPDTLEELIDAMEKHPDRYQHLKVFLRRNGINNFPEFGEEYLAVSCDGFGLHRIDAVKAH